MTLNSLTYCLNTTTMKKTLLLCLLSTINFIAYSQCTPDPLLTSPGIYPDSETGFSNACTGVSYSQIVTNVVPADTSILVFGIPIPTSIDSIVLANVAGLPPGMTYACNPAGCSYIGGTSGCAVITGICNVDGFYPLVFNLKAYVGGLTTPNSYVVDYYSITVSPTACLTSIEETQVSNLVISPNPTSNNIVVEGLNSKKGMQAIQLMNTEGKVINTYSVIGLDTITLPLENLNTGLYFIRLNYEEGTEVVKIIKE